jgi:hypothetical protein
LKKTSEENRILKYDLKKSDNIGLQLHLTK